jgi:8-oxo-dGTP pyrophosphatase MutT (NUDIX family)
MSNSDGEDGADGGEAAATDAVVMEEEEGNGKAQQADAVLNASSRNGATAAPAFCCPSCARRLQRRGQDAVAQTPPSSSQQQPPPPPPPIQCANCGCAGHVYRVCNAPVTSFGIICYRLREGRPEYLLVQRKDSLAFTEMVRGKYNLQNRGYVLKLLANMTSDERRRVVECSFDELWHGFWQSDHTRTYMKEYHQSRTRLETLRAGYYLRSAADPAQLLFVDLASAVASVQPRYEETEWGLPKGRRNINESDLRCACREFREETGIDVADVHVMSHVKPFEEIFTGSNRVRYRHVYYVAHLKQRGSAAEYAHELPLRDAAQSREIRSVAWFDVHGVLRRVREENVERREMFKRVHAWVDANSGAGAHGSPRRHPAPSSSAAAPAAATTAACKRGAAVVGTNGHAHTNGRQALLRLQRPAPPPPPPPPRGSLAAERPSIRPSSSHLSTSHLFTSLHGPRSSSSSSSRDSDDGAVDAGAGFECLRSSSSTFASPASSSASSPASSSTASPTASPTPPRSHAPASPPSSPWQHPSSPWHLPHHNHPHHNHPTSPPRPDAAPQRLSPPPPLPPPQPPPHGLRGWEQVCGDCGGRATAGAGLVVVREEVVDEELLQDWSSGSGDGGEDARDALLLRFV